MKNIIVTGATSIIGAAITLEALSQGKNIAAVVRKNSLRLDSFQGISNHKNLKIVECDIQDYEGLDFDTRYDAFVHLAWQGTDSGSRDNISQQIDNITYTINAVHAASRAGCEVFISAGSQAECGRVSKKIDENTVCRPESGYGIAKYAAGKMAFLETSELGMRFCHTRVLSVYGEGIGEKTLIAYLIRTLLDGKRPSLTKCEQIWDYMYAGDAARAFLAIAESGVDGKTYSIGTGCGMSLRSYIETIRDIIDPSLDLGFGEKEYYPHQPMYLCADISGLRHDTGFEPDISFEAGIRRTVDWIKKTGRNCK